MRATRPTPPILAVALLLASLLAGASAPQAEAAPRSPRAWTVMVYMAADNNLEGAAIDDINEMERIGSDSEVAVVAQIDRAPGYDTTNGNWTTTRRYYIVQDTDTASIGSLRIADLGEVNMGDPQQLAAFAQWAIANYPADHYLLIIWDHGEGWRKVFSSTGIKGIAYDETSLYDYLSLVEMGQALSQIKTTLGRKLDIVACDACLMQMVEVAYQIRNYADYHVASEESVPWDGYPYNDLLARLRADPTVLPAALCQTMVNVYVNSYSGGSQGLSEVTLSAVDLAQIASVAPAADALAVALTNGLNTYCREILTWWSGAQQYSADYRDLRHFAQLLYDNMSDPAIRTPAAALITALDNAIIYERHYGSWQANATGLTVYYPPPDYYEPPYGLLDFAADTNWDAFLAAPKPCNTIIPDAYEPDDTPQQASLISPGETQTDHWFYQEYDDDWARFNAEAGQTYGIGTKNLGIYSDTFLFLCYPDGATLIDYDDDSGPGWGSYIEWRCPASGSYYILVEHYFYSYFGIFSDYDLFVRQRRFLDVPCDYWSFDQIEACCNAHVVSGYGDYYRPTWAVPRDQMAVFIARALAGGETAVPPGPATPTFPDVPTDFWAYKHIEYVADQNVASGYSDGYHPEYALDRGQMAAFIARALVAPQGNSAIPSGPATPTFPDVPTDYWSYKHIEYIVDQGVASGYPDGYYHPERICSRDQMAVFICRAFNLPM